MAKPTKSQWDFGELFPTEAKTPSGAGATPSTPNRQVLTVAELTAKVKGLLEGQVGQVWVTGEITNLRAQSSGHFYFTLKDADSQLSCVLFRNEARTNRELLADGRKVVLQGDVTVYEPRGQYQLRVTAVELQGVGALQLAFEKLKQKLNAEGLFAPERKRPLPRFAQRIGLVTSPTGAAIRDVLHVVRRRQPGLEIVLTPCRVQGQGAAEEIADAIRRLNQFAARGEKLDLILVTRGGGSLEDLWAFNEEVVARAIFESAVPVVSAVGHEIDFTIADFVADVRAATPSAAAEIITEGFYSSLEFMATVGDRIIELARRRLQDKQYEFDQLRQRRARAHPRRRVDEWLQRLDDLQGGLMRCAKQGARNQRVALRNLRERLARLRPRQLLRERRESWQQAARQLAELARRQLQLRQRALAALEARLRLLGPQQVLARGYSITLDAATGKVIRAARSAKAGQLLRTRLESGEISSEVRESR
jgi:exodeoxyribonuclease VII large subunit